LIAILAALSISFEPAFVFPGEPFRVMTSAPAEVSSPGLRLAHRNGNWHGIAPRQPIDIYATIGPEGAYTDAAKKLLPVAKGGPIAKIGGMEIVPMHGDEYAAILNGKRFPALVTFNLAPRSAPERERPFRVDYAYVGKNHVTLSGDVGGLLRATVRIEPGRLTLNGISLFDFTGTMSLLGTERAIDLAAGGKLFFSIVIPDSAP
jgi:hypothetical protein